MNAGREGERKRVRDEVFQGTDVIKGRRKKRERSTEDVICGGGFMLWIRRVREAWKAQKLKVARLDKEKLEMKM